jgi:D-alanyl-lipoteichoic acid acyltransferase DltB (MBOAT superfamily)
MLFSSPDYPVFLIAVFFLYALARWSRGPHAVWAQLAVMVLLGDLVFMLVAKDVDALWDPIGGTLLRLAAGADDLSWKAIMQWFVGSGVLGVALVVGRSRADWIGSDAGQRLIARGFLIALAALGIALAIARMRGTLEPLTRELVAHGHLLVLAVLGVGLGVGLASDANRHRQLGRVIILFVASTLFYHAWAAAMPGIYRYLLAVLLATIVLDYYLAIWIESTEDPARRKLLVIASLCSNLGILVFFKYSDFFARDVLGIDMEPLGLILPAGISFHTFQSLSYTIDVYRRQLKATRSIVQFATFVLFFPQLVAGPIVRAHELLPQLANPPPLELHKATNGLFRIVVGLFKKIAIADTLALTIVDRVFEAPERYSSVEVLAGVYAYALQIYLDFSAYSDIAIGSAMILGFNLPENFRTPYRSTNLQEFWRRWHISLSTWLRDYLYITLGGSKGSEWRTYLNLSVTMLLGGLWHGASWTFIVWGALHGFGLAITRYFQRATARSAEAAVRMLAMCGSIAMAGYAIEAFALDGHGAWTHLVVLWLAFTPLWAVKTAWLGRERPAVPEPATALPPIREALRVPDARTVELLRIAMCVAGAGFLLALEYGATWTWIPLVLLVWTLGLAADLVEKGPRDAVARLLTTGRRIVAGFLVFHYVCLAWIFFRATSFDNALAILRQLSLLETDHANLVPLVTTALAAGFAFHFFPDGSFRWLRDRFVKLPPEAMGVALACVVLVLRELGQTKIVPFIYFQF